jgi:peptidoglycan hydrolase CwlO-like protein
VTELSFLIDLLLNHKLAKATKDAIAERIKEVETAMGSLSPMQVMLSPPKPQAVVPSNLPAEIAKQAPSMQAIMLRHADLAQTQRAAIEPALHEAQLRNANIQASEPQPVAVVAQTAATAAAMASRNQAIAESLAGKIDKTTGRPRKF